MKKMIILVLTMVVLSCSPLLAKVTYISYKDDVTYQTQKNTGTYSNENCGIASLKMALNFINVKANSVSELRNQVRPYAGWVFTSEIEDFLDDRDIPYGVEWLDNKEVFKEYLNDGILMLCLDMSKVSAPYNTGTGHFIIVVGYYLDGKEERLEVYDPAIYGTQYYKLEEVYESAKDWCGYVYLFKQKNNPQ